LLHQYYFDNPKDRKGKDRKSIFLYIYLITRIIKTKLETKIEDNYFVSITRCESLLEINQARHNK